MGLDGYPDPTVTELDRDANPVACDFCVSVLDSNEVFTDGERILLFGFDALVEPLCPLFVCRIEFNAGTALQEPLQDMVFVVENLALDVGQPYDLRLDDFLHLHFTHRFLFFSPSSSGPFWGEVAEISIIN